MKHCPNCYEQLRDTEKKCHACGYNLSDITNVTHLTDKQLRDFETLKWIDIILRIVYIVYIIAAVIFLIHGNLRYTIYLFDENISIIVLAVGGALFLRSIISSLHFKNWRCPSCHKYLKKLEYNAKYCPYCGKVLM